MPEDTPPAPDEASVMESAVAESLAGQPLQPQDAAMAALARSYARAIDRSGLGAEALADLGPKLFACLESLGLSPRARAAVKKGGTSAGTGGPQRRGLDELRERRTRKHDAAPLDPAAP